MREMTESEVPYESRAIKNPLRSLFISIKIHWVAKNSTLTFCIGVSLLVNEGIRLNSVISGRQLLIQLKNDLHSNSWRHWHRWRNWNRFRTGRFQTGFLGGDKIDINGFEQVFALSLTKFDPQVWSHTFFFFLLFTNNGEHYPINPCF